MKDLVILAADKDLEFSLKGLLGRPEALGICPVNADIYVEPDHDPACALRGVEFLRNFQDQYRYALLMFDHEGSGKETAARKAIQAELNSALTVSGWGDRAEVIVLEPELEAWVWSDSLHVDDVAGWKDRDPKLRPWLVEQGWLNEGETKPSRPKEAFEAALRAARKPRSASLYKKLADNVGVRRCTDVSFGEFVAILRKWFPVAPASPKPRAGLRFGEARPTEDEQAQ
jgi:hypothetical protein